MADGIGCKCCAWSESECCCAEVDWTPQEIYDLRAKIAILTKALEFYADGEKYDIYSKNSVLLDNGRTAREALKGRDGE